MKVSLESVLERPKGVEEWSPSIVSVDATDEVSVDATDEEYVAFYDQHPERIERLSPRSRAILDSMRERMRGHRDEDHALGSIVSSSS